MGKLQKVKVLSANTILFAISSFGTKFISFFLVPLYTYVLSTEEYGNLDLMLTTAQLLVPFLTLNIQDAVIRFALDKNNNPKDVMSIGMRIVGVSSCILFVIIFLTVHLIPIPLDKYYLWYLFFLFFTNALHNIFKMYLKATDKIKLLVASGIFHTLLTCVLSIVLLVVFKLGVIGYMIANISGSAFALAIMFVGGNVKPAMHCRTSYELFKSMTSYSFPLVFSTVAWWINNASDRYILTFFCGAAVNGIYALAYKIPTMLSTIQGIFYSSWSISAITEFDAKDKDGFIRDIYAAYSCISFLGCSFLMLFNIFISKVLYAKDFFQAWHYSPILILAVVFNGIGLFEGCLFSPVKKTKEVAVTTVIGAAINTIFNFILIPVIGAYGASIATLLGYFVIWITRIYQLKKFVELKIEWLIQSMSILFLIIQCAVSVTTEKFYFQIPLMCVILFLQKKYIKKFFLAAKKSFHK